MREGGRETSGSLTGKFFSHLMGKEVSCVSKAGNLAPSLGI